MPLSLLKFGVRPTSAFPSSLQRSAKGRHMLNEHTLPVQWHQSRAATLPHRSMPGEFIQLSYPFFKRCLDLLIATVLLVLLAPLMLAIAVAIKLDSPGSVIYIQRRCGLQGRVFNFYKFRSMTSDRDHTLEHRKFAEAYINGAGSDHLSDGNGQAIYKPATNGHTVTRVGRWLRRTSLDELPQLINILKGDMSMVGPRPSIDYEVALYTGRQRERLAVLPGLTGWAQINGRSRLSFDTIVLLDLEYIAERSLVKDLQIIFATVFKVLAAEDAG